MHVLPETEPRGIRGHSIEAMGLTGIVFALLAYGATALLRGIPGWGADETVVERWFAASGNRNRLMAMAMVMLVASIALLWFIGAIRRRVGDHEDRLFSTVFLGSGLILIAILLMAVAAFAIPATLADQVSPQAAAESYRLSYGLGLNLMTIVAPRVSAVFMLSLSNLGRLTSTFPNWLTVMSTVTVLFLLFAVTLSLHIAWIFPTWCLIVGIVIVWRRKQWAAI